ncbi:glycosyltransferase family 2 protein [Candidatus Chrysopegis kryptomonas]|uniref:Glycosyltransferase involved in cell wall bisynthesis n=1 Tax=Candidatus Chryseopegocella kryptomonas TaxID=1633643 RepID=A0A0P1MZ37_9BACT|nr:glycosyltransferase family 2 protein [Candidatus Chrysopegis kryptomonas]CUT01349.1 Glycosyltransferase involved in cell wall bisynthesis [Candidatus Chrysopegis kryptomonas]
MARTKEKQLISIVIPLYNEVESLNELYQQINEVVKANKYNYEIIFVDDGSDDGSLDVLKKLRQKDKNVKIISFRRNYGKSAALAVGFEHAKGDVVITMDADLQDDPHEIPNLLKKLNEGYDLVSGWKKKRYDPITKTIPSKIFNFTVSTLTGIKIHDFNCGLKAYRKSVTQDIKVYGELHRYLPVLAHWAGYKIGEVIVQHHPRKYGKTKFGISRFLKGFLDLLTVLFTTRYFKRPLHLFGTVGLLVFLLGFGITLYLSLLKIIEGIALSNRPLFILGIMLTIVGVQFISIGLLGEMITRAYQHLETYSIKEIHLD